MPVPEIYSDPTDGPLIKLESPDGLTTSELTLTNNNELKIGSDVVSQKAATNKTTAPTVNDDSGDGYSVGSMWYDTTADKAYVCLDATAAAAVWKEVTASGGSDTKIMELAFGSGTTPYVSTTSASWTVIGRFRFRGTTALGTPTAITALTQVSVAESSQVRIYDASNSNVIATSALFADTSWTLRSLGSLSSLPTGSARFELQGWVDSATLRVAAVSFAW